LELSGELLGFLEIFLGEVGDVVEPGGCDADLLSRSRERASEGLEGALAVIERFIFITLVAGHKRDQGDERAAEHQRGDGKDSLGRERLGRVVRDVDGGGSEDCVDEEENPERQVFGGRIG